MWVSSFSFSAPFVHFVYFVVSRFGSPSSIQSGVDTHGHWVARIAKLPAPTKLPDFCSLLSPTAPVQYMEIFINPRQAEIQRLSSVGVGLVDCRADGPVASRTAGRMVTPGGWIGRGIYNPHSRIRVRLYQWVREAPLDEGWLHGRLQQAVALRRDWMQRHQPLDAVRWVNSEGEGLSGLIIDQFGEFVVIQLTALAMAGWESSLVGWISETLRPGGILLRVDASTAKAEGLAAREELVFGALPAGPIEIDELGVKLRLDPRSGQKTGSYLDQRSNRRLAADWIGDGPMLDVCCYHGGFALAAHRWARPSRITAVDSSLKALTQAEMNAQLNGADIDFVQADCFDYLSDLCETDAAFDTVVLDPPRMAAQRSQISAAPFAPSP